MLELAPVGPDNWRLGLHVRDDQKTFVASSAGILARAYAYREQRSRAFVIYDGGTPIGMAMYHDFEDSYVFSQFFIDERYQGRGCGYRAAKLVLQKMQNDGVHDKVVLCYVAGDEAAKQLYLKLGFTHTGEVDGDEIMMEKQLR